ncbi:hypothetical protein BGZ70_005196, partial [Mortierella alpina]
PPPSAGPLAALSRSDVGHENGQNNAGEATIQDAGLAVGNGNNGLPAHEDKTDVRTHNGSGSSIASLHGSTYYPSVT